MATLLPAVNVSPLIRFGRWTALISGIMWGIHRHRVNTKKENAYQEYEAKQKVVRDAKAAIEKKRAVREEMLYLAKESGVKIPADFEERFG